MMDKQELVLLRACEENDLDKVLEIERASFSQLDAYDRDEFLKCMRANPEGFLVAATAHEIIGYVIASVEGEWGVIVSIAVAPRHRRLGIGSMLINSAMERLANNVRKIKLAVSMNNKAALNMYDRLSFSPTSRRRNYYLNGDDGLFMVKELEGRHRRPAEARTEDGTP